MRVILPGERKSVEPIAARVEPRRVQGAHQSLHHFVANADWSQEALLRQVRTFVLPAIEKSGGVKVWTRVSYAASFALSFWTVPTPTL
jgi:SRSO17 transposase